MITVKDEMKNEVVPIEPQSFIPIDIMQDNPKSANDQDGADMKCVQFSEDDTTPFDPADPKYQKVLDTLIENGYTNSKFLGSIGYLVAPQKDNIRLVCKSIEEGFIAQYRIDFDANPDEYIRTKALADDLNLILSGATTNDTKDRHVNESSDTKVKYILQVNDPDGKIKDLLDYIRELSDSGHSFPVMVDAQGDERHKEFFIDGDGSNKIYSIERLNEEWDEDDYESIEVTYHDAKLLRDNQAFYGPQYVRTKAKMLRTIAEYCMDSYYIDEKDPRPQEVMKICDELLSKYKEED